MDGSQSLGEFRRIANREAVAFDWRLEQVVKRHDPREWAVEATKRLVVGWPGKPGQLLWTPHEVLHTIEASSAYARGHRDRPVREQDLRNAINVFRDGKGDPYLLRLLEHDGSLEMFFRALARWQIELQSTGVEDRLALGRFTRLFMQDEPLAKFSVAMHAAIGLTVRAWWGICCAVWAHLQMQDKIVFSASRLKGASLLDINDTSLEAFWGQTARSIETMRSQYRADRERLENRYLQICLRSRFLERPMVQLDHENFLCPARWLMIQHLGSGLVEVGDQVNRDLFRNELGKSFEMYIEHLIAGTYPELKIHRGSVLRSFVGGKKSCDLLVELADCVLLVECKATFSRMRLVTASAMRRDTLNQQVCDAFEQLQSTTMAVKQRGCDLGVSESKPILAIVVVLGDVYFANSDWYWTNVFQQILAENHASEVGEFAGMVARPQVMSSGAFERFVAVLRHTFRSPVSVVLEKLALNDMQVGDWREYLPRTVDEECNWILPELSEAFELTAKQFADAQR